MWIVPGEIARTAKKCAMASRRPGAARCTTSRAARGDALMTHGASGLSLKISNPRSPKGSTASAAPTGPRFIYSLGPWQLEPDYLAESF